MATLANRLTHNATQASTVPNLALMTGCLHGLILLNGVQLAAGLAAIDLSPPQEVLPLLAATAALGVIASPLVRAGNRLGFGIGIAFCLVSMIGMGPHKLFLDDGAVLAPIALAGFAAELAFIWAAVQALREDS